MKKQVILSIEKKADYQKIEEILKINKVQKYLLVCGKSAERLSVMKYFQALKIPYTKFNDFKPNPAYESIAKGVEVFQNEACDFIVAIGGGSAMDVAKCIKLFSNMTASQNDLKQPITPNNISILAIPTTAGTGSESTHFAVVYCNNEKQSIHHERILPDYVILDPTTLETLPDYQKKSALFDALCQGIESMWSVNSTEESKTLAEQSIRQIMQNMDKYLSDSNSDINKSILAASNLAGQAINLTQTTAAHAMSYKLTSMFGMTHGQAVALCLPKVWRYMIGHLDDCTDPRGSDYLKEMFFKIADAMGEKTPLAAINIFENLLKFYKMQVNIKISEKQLNTLANSVNPIRLKNNPIQLNEKMFKEVYSLIIRE